MNGTEHSSELTPPKVGRPDGLAPNLNGAPEEVKYGVWAWLSVASMQALVAIFQFIANIVDPRAIQQQLKEQSESLGGLSMPGGDIAQQASTLNVSMLIMMVLMCGLCAWLSYRAGRGGQFSRMFLNVGSLYLALQAGLLVFGGSPASMPVGFVLIIGIFTILSGVVAPLGMWFMSRPGNDEWLGIPPMAEMQKYAEAVERRRKEERDAKKAQKDAKKKGR